MDASEVLRQIERKDAYRKKFTDLFLLRIDDIEFCLESKRYISALAMALTLPDICGKAEFPTDGNTSRYIKWFNQNMTLYKKMSSQYDADMPYLSGEVVYNLRNSLLHSGNPNITKASVKEEICRVDKFKLLIGETYDSDTSMVAYGKNMAVVWREYEVNIYLLCTRLCRVAKEYYLNNKNKFNFFNYELTFVDD